MRSLEPCIADLPDRHKMALLWFHDRSGSVQEWPGQLDNETFLATRAKGIYKPAWTKYALSVRQSLESPYPDKEPVERADGTWFYAYYQEGIDPAKRDATTGNKALMLCLQDGIPVGVLRQVSPAPKPKYIIQGTAIVSDWHDGYFYLEGFSREGLSQDPGATTIIDVQSEDVAKTLDDLGVFDPSNISDARDRIIAAIVLRRGQSKFRRTLLSLYHNTCAISDCDAESALEAAHIVPYLGEATNHPSNGILLRADLHTLFDSGLIGIDPVTNTVRISNRLRDTVYHELEGKVARMPDQEDLRPMQEALASHLQSLELEDNL